MPRALAVPLRQEIVDRHRRGETLVSIAAELALPYYTVRKVWRYHAQRGDLRPRYDRCGRPGVRASRWAYRCALALKRRHPRWGATLILTLLRERRPEEPLPCERTIQEWFAGAGLNTPRRPHAPLPTDPHRARDAHEVWQMDAKERVALKDGTEVSWLTLTDEASGALIGAEVSPPGPVEPGRPPGREGEPAAGLRAVGAARPTAGR
jgi:hypothetical protein